VDRNRKYLDPIFDLGTSGLMSVNANALDVLHIRKEWGPRVLSGEKGRPVDARPNDGRGKARSSRYRNSSTAHFDWQLTGDKHYLEELYAKQIEECDLLDYINTEGSLWIDRVGVPYVDLQRARLGGVALVRNGTFPGHVASWRFTPPANDQSVAILIPDATATGFKVIACNLETNSVQAAMTGWNIDPGVWEITQGVDTNDDDKADVALTSRTNRFERSSSLEFTFAPRSTTILTLKQKMAGTPYWQRPDLGICRDDVEVDGDDINVRIHSLGSVPSPQSTVVFRDRSGQIVAREEIPAIAAPVDLYPKTADVVLSLPAGINVTGGTVEIDPDHRVEEITRLNNTVKL